jgi:16S rRNA (guanine966-N2)-methyltransferase
LIANRVRIVGGEYRSRILRFPPHPELRPTPDRVRETLFNWLGQDLRGRACLDLFAGSGALGFEAASRAARPVVMVERDRRSYQALLRNAQLLGCENSVEVLHADALQFARAVTSTFDVVFLDPPFDSGLMTAIVPLIARLTRPGGAVYVETAGGLDLESPWRQHRRARAGHVTYQLFIHGDQ